MPWIYVFLEASKVPKRISVMTRALERNFSSKYAMQVPLHFTIGGVFLHRAERFISLFSKELEGFGPIDVRVIGVRHDGPFIYLKIRQNASMKKANAALNRIAKRLNGKVSPHSMPGVYRQHMTLIASVDCRDCIADIIKALGSARIDVPMRFDILKMSKSTTRKAKFGEIVFEKRLALSSYRTK